MIIKLYIYLRDNGPKYFKMTHDISQNNFEKYDFEIIICI